LNLILLTIRYQAFWLADTDSPKAFSSVIHDTLTPLKSGPLFPSEGVVEELVWLFNFCSSSSSF